MLLSGRDASAEGYGSGRECSFFIAISWDETKKLHAAHKRFACLLGRTEKRWATGSYQIGVEIR